MVLLRSTSRLFVLSEMATGELNTRAFTASEQNVYSLPQVTPRAIPRMLPMGSQVVSNQMLQLSDTLSKWILRPRGG